MIVIKPLITPWIIIKTKYTQETLNPNVNRRYDIGMNENFINERYFM